MRGALPLALLAALVLLPSAQALALAIHAQTAADGSMRFTPSEVRVPQGERVTLTLVNDDPSTPHDWALLEYGGRDVEVYVRGGETRTVNFTANEAGTYRIVCQVVGHKQQGMEGRLVVEEKSLLPGPGLWPFALVGALALLRRREA